MGEQALNEYPTSSRLNPGLGGVDRPKKLEVANQTIEDPILDFIRNVFPENIVQAWTGKSQTELEYPRRTNQTSTIKEDDKLTWNFIQKWSPGANFVGLIAASLVPTSVLISRESFS